MKPHVLAVALVLSSSAVAKEPAPASRPAAAPQPAAARFEAPAFDFSMAKPAGWFAAGTDMIENLNRYALNDDERARLIKGKNGALRLASFTKYDAATHAGAMPTVNVLVIAGGAPTFEAFAAAMQRSAEGSGASFKDFQVVRPATKVLVDGALAVDLTVTFSMTAQDGSLVPVRARTLAIPRPGHFLQVSFVDVGAGEDDAAVFDALVASIKVTKRK